VLICDDQFNQVHFSYSTIDTIHITMEDAAVECNIPPGLGHRLAYTSPMAYRCWSPWPSWLPSLCMDWHRYPQRTPLAQIHSPLHNQHVIFNSAQKSRCNAKVTAREEIINLSHDNWTSLPLEQPLRLHHWHNFLQEPSNCA
jgi:hypothetical protein